MTQCCLLFVINIIIVIIIIISHYSVSFSFCMYVCVCVCLYKVWIWLAVCVGVFWVGCDVVFAFLVNGVCVRACYHTMISIWIKVETPRKPGWPCLHQRKLERERRWKGVWLMEGNKTTKVQRIIELLKSVPCKYVFFKVLGLYYYIFFCIYTFLFWQTIKQDVTRCGFKLSSPACLTLKSFFLAQFCGKKINKVDILRIFLWFVW